MPELKTEFIPLLPLNNAVVLPGMVVTIPVEREESGAAIAAAREGDGLVLLVPRVDADRLVAVAGRGRALRPAEVIVRDDELGEAATSGDAGESRAYSARADQENTHGPILDRRLATDGTGVYFTTGNTQPAPWCTPPIRYRELPS